MRITVDAMNAARNNNDGAKLREGTRMAMLASCLSRLGHRVSLRPNPELVLSDRLKVFKDVLIPNGAAEVLICPREGIIKRPQGYRAVVGFKTSVGTDGDVAAVGIFDVLIAHEYDQSIDKQPGLLPIPFAVHDRTVAEFVTIGAMDRYLDDDVDFFRDRYCSIDKKREAGFVGLGDYGRKAMASGLPKWCDVRFESETPTSEYLSYLGSCKAGLCFPGATPKTNRFSELALLGVPIICEQSPVRVVPAVTRDNAILLDGWDDWDRLERGMKRLEEIAINATFAYRDGWSILAQAKRLDLMLKERLAA